MVWRHGRSLVQSRNAIEARAVELLGEHPDYQLLRSVPGIRMGNALAVLAEAGNLRRFLFRGRGRIPKYGNARLRRTLWLASQAAVLQRTNGFRDKFERYVAQDPHNPDLCRAAARPSPPRWPAPFTP